MMLPVVLTLIVAGFITVIVVISSYFSYKEKEMLVKHGVDPEGVRKIAYKEEYLEPITKLTSLRSAVTLIAVGGALPSVWVSLAWDRGFSEGSFRCFWASAG